MRRPTLVFAENVQMQTRTIEHKSNIKRVWSSRRRRVSLYVSLTTQLIHSCNKNERERDRPRAFALPPFPSPLLLATLLFFALRSRYGCPPGLNRQGCLKRAQCSGEEEKKKQLPLCHTTRSLPLSSLYRNMVCSAEGEGL